MSIEAIDEYLFEYIDEEWSKNASMRLLRVLATNPKGRQIEVGVLTDDKKRRVPEVIELIFKRWLQENDFKYLDEHFGINEITSYQVIPYTQLEGYVTEKQIKAGQYKALEVTRREIKKMLRLEFLVQQDFVRLDTHSKQLMDAIKIIARNAFYKMLQPFKEMYNNYRDDHVLFRNLTRSDGLLRQNGNVIEIFPLPTPIISASPSIIKFTK